ncbi:MAG: BRCT domain-containing protein [Sedimentisphaerales bacterium]
MPLYGKVLVVTGALKIPRKEAADMAARVGYYIDQRVTERTTILVVGDQDVKKYVKKFASYKKSSKHRKTEDLISKGQTIRILGETDFRKLAQLAN